MDERLKRDAVRRVLVTGLRTAWMGALCQDEPDRYKVGSERLSMLLVASFFLGNAAVVASQLGRSVLLVAPMLLVAVLVLAWITSPPFTVTFLGVSWVGTLIAQLLYAPLHDAALTHGLTAALVAAIVAVSRARRFVQGAPLLLPVALIVLVVPLFSADLWQAAAELRPGRFVALACLTVVPLALALIPELLRIGSHAFERAAEAGAGDAQTIGDAFDSVKKLGSKQEEFPEDSFVSVLLNNAYNPDFVNKQAAILQQQLRPSLRRRLTWSLVPLTLGIGGFVTFYMYVVAWTVIHGSTAERWLGDPVPYTHVIVLGDLPTGPYVQVALLMGVLATAIFYAFVLTDEEKYVGTLSDLVIHAPLRRGVLLAMPYAWIREVDGSPQGVEAEASSPGQDAERVTS